MQTVWIILLCIALLAITGAVVFLLIKTWHCKCNTKENSLFTEGYKIVHDWVGKDLIPGTDWQWFTQPDPTKGSVKYGPQPSLMTVTGNSVKISVSPTVSLIPNPNFDNTKPVDPVSNPKQLPQRGAVRINSAAKFDNGLFVLKAPHLPQGLAVWPAFWLTNADNWPCDGEIDIIEYVNSVDAASSNNASSLHTAPGCSQPGSKNPDCNSTFDGAPNCKCGGVAVNCPDQGCVKSGGIGGFGYNQAGGGMYACELTPGGVVTIWYFPTSQIPADIESGNPVPANWPVTGGSQKVSFSSPCPGKFSQLQIVLNTTLCGAFAGGTFPGQGGAPPPVSGAPPRKPWDYCNYYVAQSSNTFADAYWTIDYLKVFQGGGAPAPPPCGCNPACVPPQICQDGKCVTPPPPSPGGYKNIYTEDWSKGIDPGMWSFRVGGDCEITQGCVGYTKEACTTDSDGLHIKVTAGGSSDPDHVAKYTSGYIYGNVPGNSYGWKSVFSVCATVPKGNLLWPAIWLLGDGSVNGSGGWPMIGEIDIMETVDAVGDTFGTLHCGPTVQTDADWPVRVAPPAKSPNMYATIDYTKGPVSFALEWQTDHITWYWWYDPTKANNPLDSSGKIRSDLNVGQTVKYSDLPANAQAECLKAFGGGNKFKFVFNVCVGGLWWTLDNGGKPVGCHCANRCNCANVPVPAEMVIHSAKVFQQ